MITWQLNELAIALTLSPRFFYYGKGVYLYGLFVFIVLRASRRWRVLDCLSGKSKLEYIRRYEEINAYQSVTFSGGKHGSVIMDKVLSD